MMDQLAGMLLFFAAAATAAHLVTTALMMRRVYTSRLIPAKRFRDVSVSLLRPICGLEDCERETLASTFALSHVPLETIFCCEDAADPAIAHIAHVRPQADTSSRILVGRQTDGPNPKLNNLLKGWRVASHDWVVLADSNVSLPRETIAHLLQTWRADTGLVCAPPIGDNPNGFWAAVECAFLNTYQARWQYAADAFGYGFAQGKIMLCRRGLVDRAGGLQALSRELAEDAAATKLVREAGLRVRLSDPVFRQPLGHRSYAQVINRQLRWAQLRRLSFPMHFALEVLTGALLPVMAGSIGAGLTGGDALLTGCVMASVWYGAEAVLARYAKWPLAIWSPLAWLARDLLILVIWARGWTTRVYEWRGHTIVISRRGAGELVEPPIDAGARAT